MRMPPKRRVRVGQKEEEFTPYNPDEPVDVSFIHIHKKQTPPRLLKDSEYPEWIFDKTLAERWTIDKFQNLDMTNAPPEIQKKYAKILRKNKIRNSNQLKRNQRRRW